MKSVRFLLSSLIVMVFALSCSEPDSDNWQLGPFERYEGDPILTPRGNSWEAKDVFNPAAWSDGETIYMLYRAEDSTGVRIWNGTSRVGLAKSSDGINVTREPDPVYEPVEEWELPGGAEDPRVTKIDDRFYMIYTAYEGETARLALASSTDLETWDRHGLIFPELGWTKAGAIAPQKINDRYWMCFGDTNIWIAWSEDLINWTAIEQPVMRTRDGMFNSGLIKPGPTPIITDQGILMLYNSADDDLVYRTAQALFNLNDPTKLLKRSDTWFLAPELEMEVGGQIPNVVFIEGYAELGGRGFLYYGMGDSGIGVAVTELE